MIPMCMGAWHTHALAVPLLRALNLTPYVLKAILAFKTSGIGRIIESSVTLWSIATFACNDAFIRFAQTHDVSPDHSGVVDRPCTDINHPEELRHCETVDLNVDPWLNELLEPCMRVLYDLVEVCSRVRRDAVKKGSVVLGMAIDRCNKANGTLTLFCRAYVGQAPSRGCVVQCL